MASKIAGDKHQGLVCPICLDVLKNATLLSCGHTFCKECLEAYDEQHSDLDHIVCPVCRKPTKLGRRRIAGLTPNLLALGIQDQLDVVVPSPSFCSLHSKVHNDLFCEVCKKFICFTCYLENHKDHKVKTKEELEGDLKQKRVFLIQKGETRKGGIEKCVNIAEQQRIDIHCHLSKVEKKIREAFALKVTILQENEEVLLSKVDSIRRDSDKQVERFIANHRELIDSITSSITPLTGNMSRYVNSDKLKAHYLQCSNLEKSLEKIIDDDSIVHLKQSAESAKFCPADKTLLTLGHIEMEVKETTSTTQHAQYVKTAAGGNKKVEKLQPSSKVVGVPALVENTSNVLNIIRKVDAPARIMGMSALSQDAVGVGYEYWGVGADCFSVSPHVKTAAGGNKKVEKLQPSSKVIGVLALVENTSNVLNIIRKVDAPARIMGMSALSQDAVVVGYGYWGVGADCFSVSGEKKQHLKSEVGQVYDIAFLTDGRSVVSHGNDTFHVYNTHYTHSTGMRYTCKECHFDANMSVCSDQNDNIYAVNGNPEIYIFHARRWGFPISLFHGSNPNPHTIIPTGIQPKQICVTNTGVMITSTCDITPSTWTVTVFDREGRVGSSITASDNEYLYTAVDSVDRVLVARVRRGSYVFRLTRYTLQGTTLIEQMTFKALKLHHQCETYCVSYMTSLSPNMLAFANGNYLYFIKIGV